MSNSTFTSCHDWLEQLSKPVGDLSPSERSELEAHLISCPTCSVIQMDYKMIGDLIRSLPAPAFPPGLPPRLQQMLREEHESEDNSAISGIVIDREGGATTADSYIQIKREGQEIPFFSLTDPSLSGTGSQNTDAYVYAGEVEPWRSIDYRKSHLSLLRRVGMYLSGQDDILRWLVALTIGPFANVCCTIYRWMGISVYVDRLLVCHSCKRLFLFTAKAQRVGQQRGLPKEPGECPSCCATHRVVHHRMSESSQEMHEFHDEVLHS